MASNWRFDPAQLGESQLGTNYEIEALGEPHWLKKEIMLGYAEKALTAAEHAISFIDEEKFQEAEPEQLMNQVGSHSHETPKWTLS